MKPKRLINGIIPTNKCNLSCPYCYISQLPDYMKATQSFEYTPEHIAKCLSAERLGGCCLINLTGEGETMLQPELVKLCELLLKQGHYMEIVTNLTVKKVVDEFLRLPADLQKHLEFKVSFHYEELKRKNMLDGFIENLKKIQQSDYSFTLELMSADSQIQYIPEIMEFCKKYVGAKCHVTVGRNEKYREKSLLSDLSMSDYVNTWSVFESTMFDFKMDLLDVKRKEFCYAGDWTLFVNMHTGEARSCYAQPFSQNIFKDCKKSIKFHAVGYHCVQPYCFNGHAFLSLGAIPEMKAPTYLEIRNRTRDDGTEWFGDDAKEFFGSKLVESNREYSSFKKKLNYIEWYCYAAEFALSQPQTVARYIKLTAGRIKNKKQER